MDRLASQIPFWPAEEIATEVEAAGEDELCAYLLGAMHDGTISKSHATNRIASKDREWLLVIRFILERLGRKGWIYQEGKRRAVHVLEFNLQLNRSCLRTPQAKVAYARGYFDAEGGVPQKSTDRFYIQLVQKDREDLGEVRTFLQESGIVCGRLHNPSAAIDPNYWRFYVRASWQRAFARKVGSWNLRKRLRLMESCV